MFGARSVTVLVSASLLALSACTTITPLGPSSSPAAPGASQPVPVVSGPLTPTEVPQPTDMPTAVPTEAPPTEVPPTDALPTSEPTDQPTATPTAKSEPGKANLVPTKLVLDPESPQPGEEIEATLTVANKGGTEASLPVAGVLGLTTADNDEALSVVNFTGFSALAPGDSVDVSAIFTIVDAGSYRVFAIVDADEAVAESNEDDNRLVANVDTVTAPNLSVPLQGFYIHQKDDGSGGYEAVLVYDNSGTEPLDAPFQVKLFYYTEAGDQGDWGTFDVEQIQLAPGFTLTQKFDIDVRQPGSYLAYALLDPDDTVVETNEDDNEARFDFTAPAPI